VYCKSRFLTLSEAPLPFRFKGGQNMCSTHGVFCVLTRWNALTPSLRATPLPRAFKGGQNMCSTHGVFCVLTRWKALTPSLRATPLPRAGEGPGGEGVWRIARPKNRETLKRSVRP
jgi:hypothetical protein